MKDRSLLLIIVGLGVMSVIIDFANAILSRMADGLLIGMMAYVIWKLHAGQRARLATSDARRSHLERENADLRRSLAIHR